MIRSSLGTPRRLSLRFLREERGRLELWRNRVRSAHREAWRSGSAAVLPPGVPPPLQVGQRVLALHPRTQQVHDGSILTRGQNEFRVQFDIEELGTEKVRDVDIVPWDPVEGVPLGLTVPGALTTPAVEAAQEGGATAARGATRQLDFSHGGGVAEVDAGVSVAGLRAKEAVRAAREEARQRLRKGAVKEKGAGGAGAGAASEAAMAVGGEALALVVAVKRCLSDPDALALSTHVLEQAMLEISRACTGAQVTGPVQEIAGLVSELKRLMAG
ncbi:unnamed protein product [Pedinophyceae sp. YPF-701]|nr:unnamed protein product [Pedinophyceae sp. YPF-701]